MIELEKRCHTGSAFLRLLISWLLAFPSPATLFEQRLTCGEFLNQSCACFRRQLAPLRDFFDCSEAPCADFFRPMHHTDLNAGRCDFVSRPNRVFLILRILIFWHCAAPMIPTYCARLIWASRSSAPCKIYPAAT